MSKMAFWNNGSPRIVRVGMLDKVSGRFIGGNPDPGIDLYAFVEKGSTPGRFETPGVVVYSKAGTTVTATRSVVGQSTEQIVSALRTEVKNKRNQVRDAGIAFGAYVVQTDTASKDNIDAEVSGLEKSGDVSTVWRMLDNSMVVITAAEFTAMALSVRAHWKACFARQAELEAALDIAADPTTVPINDGWPSHYIAPGV